jgi:hypothetical protein
MASRLIFTIFPSQHIEQENRRRWIFAGVGLPLKSMPGLGESAPIMARGMYQASVVVKSVPFLSVIDRRKHVRRQEVYGV